MQVELQHVRKSYPLPGGSGTVTALDGVNLVIESGALCILNGPSGSGKTTLLSVIGGLSRPTSGSVTLDGKVQNQSDRQRGMVTHAFQEPVFIPELTVQENLLLPALRYGDRFSTDRGERLLEAFGLGEMFDFFPAALSGGEKRRLNLARSLFLPPRLLLIDEPAAYLDDAWQAKAMEMIIREVRDARATLVMATHSPLPGIEGFRRILMYKGKVIEDGTSDY
jgi:putative ABC transport system ATP-binding protein